MLVVTRSASGSLAIRVPPVLATRAAWGASAPVRSSAVPATVKEPPGVAASPMSPWTNQGSGVLMRRMLSVALPFLRRRA